MRDFDSDAGPAASGSRFALVDASHTVVLEGRLAPPVESLPFPVAPGVLSRRTVPGMSARNAAAREAPADAGGGYYDCNSKLGEAYSHGQFVAGLIATAVQSPSLPPAERDTLVAAARRAVLYILESQRPDGSIANQHPSRPWHIGFGLGTAVLLNRWLGLEFAGVNEGPWNTQKAAWGLSHYVSEIGQMDPEVSKRAEAVLRLALARLEADALLYPRLRAALRARLWLASGRDGDRDRAIDAVSAQIGQFDLRASERVWWQGVPTFEGLALMLRALDGQPAYAPLVARWRARATEIAARYREIATDPGFRVVPLGGARAFDARSEASGAIDPGFGYTTGYMATTALDAILLSEIVGDCTLLDVAAAHISWIGGLHPGVPGDAMVPPSSEHLGSAAFITNAGARYAAPWREWYWTPPTDLVTTVNGFAASSGGEPFTYDPNRYESSETFISHDGAWLSLMAAWERVLDGACAPTNE